MSFPLISKYAVQTLGNELYNMYDTPSFSIVKTNAPILTKYKYIRRGLPIVGV
jgi:hypothetical protein